MIDLNSPQAAQELRRIVDEQVRQRLAELVPRRAYGVVAAIDPATAKASVLLQASPFASPGFTYPRHLAPAVGDRVRVVSHGGDRYVEDVLPTSLLTANPVYTQVDAKPVTDGPLTYPLGVSLMVIASALGWPTDFGTVTTYRTLAGTTRTFQTITGTSGLQWIRSAHTGAPDGVWYPWVRSSRQLRFTPLSSEFAPYNAATQAGTGSEVDKSLELTGIPANLEGVVLSTGRLLARHSAAPASSGQYAVVRHHTGNITTAVAYASNATQWAGLQWTAELGGTNNRTLRCAAHGGASGTLTFHLTYSGYWTEE